MQKSVVSFVLSMLLQTFAATLIMASDRVIDKPVAADTSDAFAQAAGQIRAQMNPSGRYENISATDKAKVETDLNSMAAMLQKSGSVAAMNPQEKVALFNTQEHVNGILTHSDSNRLVCERHAPVGTNIPINTCKTYGQLSKERRDSEKYMVDHARDANINSAAINKLGGDRVTTGSH